MLRPKCGGSLDGSFGAAVELTPLGSAGGVAMVYILCELEKIGDFKRGWQLAAADGSRLPEREFVGFHGDHRASPLGLGRLLPVQTSCVSQQPGL